MKEANAAREAGEHGQAEYLYRRSLEWVATAAAYTGLAWALSELGRHAEAIAMCEKAIRMDADQGQAYNDMGVFHLRLKKTDAAITWFEKAVRTPRYKNRFYSQFNLGLIWERRGQVEQARRCFERALKEEPGFTRAARALERLTRKAWRIDG